MRRILFAKPPEAISDDTVYCFSQFLLRLEVIDQNEWTLQFMHEGMAKRLPVPASLLCQYFSCDHPILVGYKEREFLRSDPSNTAFFNFIEEQLGFLSEIPKAELECGRMARNELLDAQHRFFLLDNVRKVLAKLGVSAPIFPVAVVELSAFLLLHNDERVFETYKKQKGFSFLAYFDPEVADRKRLLIKCFLNGQEISEHMGVTLRMAYDFGATLDDESIRKKVVDILSKYTQNLEKAALDTFTRLEKEFTSGLKIKQSQKDNVGKLDIAQALIGYYECMSKIKGACIEGLASNTQSFKASNDRLRIELREHKNATLMNNTAGINASILSHCYVKPSRTANTSTATADGTQSGDASLIKLLKVVLTPVEYRAFEFLSRQVGLPDAQQEAVYALVIALFKATWADGYPASFKQVINNFSSRNASQHSVLTTQFSQALRLPDRDDHPDFQRPSKVSQEQCYQTLAAVCQALHQHAKTTANDSHTKIFKEAKVFFVQQLEQLTASQVHSLKQ